MVYRYNNGENTDACMVYTQSPCSDYERPAEEWDPSTSILTFPSMPSPINLPARYPSPLPQDMDEWLLENEITPDLIDDEAVIIWGPGQYHE